MGVADPTNTHLWDGADVFYTPYPLGSVAIPADASTAFSADWKQCGVLDGDFGYKHSRSEDKKDFYGWGNILLRTSRNHFKLTAGFRLLEDNPETRALVWPGSTSSALKVPKPANVVLALEKRDGDIVRRVITALRAEVELNADITETEADVTGYEMLATIYPTGVGVLWIPQNSDDDESSSSSSSAT